MKTKRKVFCFLVAAFACFALTSCKELIDFAPETYGEWDGNYIYRGNVRSKTTGEEDEYLIETLEKDGVEYTVTDTNDFEYVDDDIYMCLGLRNVSENSESGEGAETSCLARYNIKEKISQVVYWETDGFSAYGIYKLSETYIILEDAYNGGSYGLFRIDYEGNVLSTDENHLYGLGTEEHLVKCENGSFSYWTWENETPVPMFYVEEEVNSYDVNYIEEANKKGFLIRIMTYEGDAHRWGSLYFYDIGERKKYDLIKTGEGVECFYQNGYVVTGVPKQETYVASIEVYDSSYPMFLPFSFLFKEYKTEEYTWDMWQNCKLYRLDWSSEEILTEVYNFTEAHAREDFTDFTLLSGGRIYFYAEEVEHGGSGCVGDGGVEYTHYILDPETKKLGKTDADPTWQTEEEEIEEARANGVTYGKYIYYATSDGYGGLRQKRAYTLWRYDTETGAADAMQFWTEESDSTAGFYEETTEEGTVTFRYSPKMWYSQDFFGADAYLVRNY